MTRFRFRLQAPLDVMLRRRERMETELAVILRRLEDQERQLQSLLCLRAESEKRAASARVGRICPTASHKEELYLAALEVEIDRQRDLLDVTRREEDRKTAELVQATQDHKALDDLRARHAEEHRKSELHEEQKFLDELASIRSARGAASA